MGKLFGTDGLRAKAGEFPLDNGTTELLGRILFFLLQDRHITPELIVGRDTRESGPNILKALCRGFGGAGGKIDDAGILPTPAVAFMARAEQKCAVSITASHNAYPDNGIKIFGPDGYKISEQSESEIEPFLLGEKTFTRSSLPSNSVDPVPLEQYFRSRYSGYLASDLFPDLNLRGMRIALDCAHGAVFQIAPAILRQMEAEVVAFNVEPNGKNINDHCGSLHPKFLFEQLQQGNFDYGFTFDGDGDRCLFGGREAMYDGDYILAAAACFLQKRGELK